MDKVDEVRDFTARKSTDGSRINPALPSGWSECLQ